MNKKFIKTLATATLLLATAGCAVGPNYKRPLVEVPTNFRAEPASSSTPEAATTLGDEQWVEIFEDATLQRLDQEALQNNPPRCLPRDTWAPRRTIRTSRFGSGRC